MNNLKYKFYRFMQGRYGNDQLNNFLFVILFAASIIGGIILGIPYISFFSYFILIIIIFRTYSRNIYKRRSENNKFLNLTKPIRKRFSVISKNRKDKTHKYYLCPSCSQTVRVPSGRGKIDITCPKCHNHFTKKS